MMSQERSEKLRKIPAVGRLLEMAGPIPGVPSLVLLKLARELVEEFRREVQEFEKEPPASKEAAGFLIRKAQAWKSRGLVRVVNATGVVLHTNLGRAPLGRDVLNSTLERIEGACALEYDIETGKRGVRGKRVEELACLLAGSEAALVVNNCAAAVFLMLAVHAKGREVIVSRGELVEIGGGFRVPEVLAEAGARLAEVGCTNRTHLKDFQAVLTPETVAVLKTHRSNFNQSGFVSEVPLAELAPWCHEAGVKLFYDQGSGLVSPHEYPQIPHSEAGEEGGNPGDSGGYSLREAIEAGVDLVACSGDKLLGGPQAGLLFGKGDLVAACAHHPLYRALRPGKVTVALLEEVLTFWLQDEGADLPSNRLLNASPESLRHRAEALAAGLSTTFPAAIGVESSAGAIGGGATPQTVLGWAVVVRPPEGGEEALASFCRSWHPPIVPRTRQDAVMFDLRSVFPEEDGVIGEALMAWFTAVKSKTS